MSDNPIGRALPILRALEKSGHDIQVMGFYTGDRTEIYDPYRGEIEPTAIQTSVRPAELFPNIRRLAHAADGDVIYAFKPLMTSFAPAYYAARIIENRPLLLDIEDEHIYLDQVTGISDAYGKLVRAWNTGTSWKYTRLLQLARRDVDATTVVSTVLQKRYGGTLLRHGPDENIFDPDRNFGIKNKLRKKRGLPSEKKLAIFIGTPRAHKGLDTIAEALSRSELNDWEFVLVGPHKSKSTAHDEPVAYLQKRIPRRTHFLGPQDYKDVPELLSLADAVPIPSKKTPFSRAQIPAKLLDAMAMAKPIVASRIGDIPRILGKGDRGWLIEPDDPDSLADALKTIEKRPQEATKRGRRALSWYKENASTSAISRKLQNIFKNIVRTY
ncbi:glycosyltransferase family 4 protein [Salinibacter ruber]|uniref:glycosyltransferase family 4 protein n=1 Tax=Salinibacter ruber TaxID=146919 RepID=UPI001613EA75|nr:glycosyltransferase family 4 protein [Salinibacter ruber]MBB4062385.1 glycosyltransferase involved in cell wall biosynthesis [Salinibacter ruber]